MLSSNPDVIFPDLRPPTVTPLVEPMDLGRCVSVNSDAPAYFGSYLGENLAAVESALRLIPMKLQQLVKNSSLSVPEKQCYLEEGVAVASAP